MTFQPGHIRRYSDPFVPTAGELAPGSKLTDKKVRHIILSDASCVALAERYGVSPARITNIRKGRSWKHVWRKLKQEGLK